MSKKTNVLDESDSLITEIESSLEKNLAKRREEIERELRPASGRRRRNRNGG